MFSKSLFMPAIAGVLFVLSSCGGASDKTGTEKSASDTAATASSTVTTVTPVSTIVTTSQSMFLVKHKVTSFAKWLTSYEAHDSMRLANGLHNYVIGRGMADSNTIMVAVKADDMAKAKAFAANANLKEAMQKGGVTGKPVFYFFTTVFQDTATISSAMRAFATFPVKDWAAWEKGFKEGQQERIENGITDRVYGHDADDDHKVMLVTAILDSAKAFTYVNSDKNKKRRSDAGVIGEPERFAFRIVKRY